MLHRYIHPALACFLLGVLLIFASGCGIHVTSDPVQVNPIIVEYRIDPTMLNAFFAQSCGDDADCIAGKVSDFFDALDYAKEPTCELNKGGNCKE